MHFYSTVAQCDVFHSESKALLPAEINNYRPVGGFDFAKVPQYCEEMKRLLEKKFKNKETLLMQHWSDVVANVVLSLSGMNTTSVTVYSAAHDHVTPLCIFLSFNARSIACEGRH